VAGALGDRVRQSRRGQTERLWWETEPGVYANPHVPGDRKRVIPEDIQRRLRELRALGDPSDIDAEDTGLAFQYLVGIVEERELDELIVQRTRLIEIIERGLWKP
jgi:hypothetical protein